MSEKKNNDDLKDEFKDEIYTCCRNIMGIADEIAGLDISSEDAAREIQSLSHKIIHIAITISNSTGRYHGK